MREKPGKLPVLHMRWRQLLFLHWAWDAREIQATLPAGLYVDTFEGKAWLAIVPFFMEAVHPTGLPSLPWLSNFLELNVRTYVHDGAGLPGVWFYSLVCNQPVAVNWLGGAIISTTSTLGCARVSIRTKRAPIACGDKVSRRHFSAMARPGRVPLRRLGSLEFFLAERYVLFAATRNGRLFAGRVHHLPYRLVPGRSSNGASFLPLLMGLPIQAARPIT